MKRLLSWMLRTKIDDISEPIQEVSAMVRRVALRIPDELYDQIIATARRKNVPASELLRQWIREGIQREHGGEG